MERATRAAAAIVGAATLTAAHRRDHQHARDEATCHPHRVEVIGLGEQAAVVCHDCCADSGYLTNRSAGRLAAAHRKQTIVDSVPLRTQPAA